MILLIEIRSLYVHCLSSRNGFSFEHYVSPGSATIIVTRVMKHIPHINLYRRAHGITNISDVLHLLLQVTEHTRFSLASTYRAHRGATRKGVATSTIRRAGTMVTRARPAPNPIDQVKQSKFPFAVIITLSAVNSKFYSNSPVIQINDFELVFI